MQTSLEKNIPESKPGLAHGCLSCGATENIGRRRYCSITCRQKLRHHLDRRTGLLKALNTRYAAFYFTESLLILDVLLYASGEIFSFICHRSSQREPADDFSRMADKLGNDWWAEIRRTNKRYLASRYLLNTAQKNTRSSGSVKPLETKKPARIDKSITYLKLGKSELNAANLHQTIKTAYRRQAQEHHPDHGGDAALFRKIHQAYQQMIAWAENPSFTKRRGFPDKWFYDGNKNKWVQPIPLSKQ